MIIRLFPEEKVFKGKKVKENEKLVLELVTFPSYTATKKKKKKVALVYGGIVSGLQEVDNLVLFDHFPHMKSEASKLSSCEAMIT